MTNDEDDDEQGDEECQRVARLNMLMMLKMVIDAGPVVIDAILMEQESPPFSENHKHLDPEELQIKCMKRRKVLKNQYIIDMLA